MTKRPDNAGVGDRLQPPLAQPPRNLEAAADARAAGVVSVLKDAIPKSVTANVAQCLANQRDALPVGSCLQTIWFSFFFDGTGNNLTYDVENLKHSNVSKLYRVHAGDENIGGREKPGRQPLPSVHRIYVPGVGTYFAAVRDPGGTPAGLGAGSYGQARLDWALTEFDRYMKVHLARAINPSNAIVEINIAAFGFSRGAAAARAFINDFVSKRCVPDGKRWKTKNGGHKVRLRFLGIFDTVASVGIPMSSNNLTTKDAVLGNTQSHIAIRLKDYPATAPRMLAFAAGGVAGADPAPGGANGHSDWGDRMRIPLGVEQVQHFIAGHETRNSFPVDSICSLNKSGEWTKPAHWGEYIFAGVHSDVGGSYSPGEGGKNASSETKFGVLPLRHMYDSAVLHGVPLLARTAWDEDQKADFAMDDAVPADYAHYLAQLKPADKTIGAHIIAHMQLYYMWRFRKIRLRLEAMAAAKQALAQGDTTKKFVDEEADLINQHDKRFKTKIALVSEKEAKLGAEYASIVGLRTFAEGQLFDAEVSDAEKAERKRLETRVLELRGQEQRAHVKWRDMAAQAFSIPKTTELAAMVHFYDLQLLRDIQGIFDDVQVPAGKRHFRTSRATLRPLYRVMVDAYENEFIKNTGLRDERLSQFCDKYVHNSLAGFGADASLPSDPRVVYVGEDDKGKYAYESVESLGNLA